MLHKDGTKHWPTRATLKSKTLLIFTSKSLNRPPLIFFMHEYNISSLYKFIFYLPKHYLYVGSPIYLFTELKISNVKFAGHF